MDWINGWMFVTSLLAALPSCLASYSQQGLVQVETTYGTVQGLILQDEEGKTQEHFLGVPFAEPPVGDLRWKRPQPLQPWDGVLNTTIYSQHCTHFVAAAYPLMGMPRFNGEDCLYLNIYVPGSTEGNRDNPLPVMVYYYGGAFILGTGQMYPGDSLALSGDVIVVNFNYRLSSLGWLASGDGVLEGNYGLWDAHSALTWVKDNIANFGGDPNRVTIFGQSAGASMVSHSVVAPPFEGLFQRAIAISGGANSFFSVSYKSRRIMLMMSQIFNCNTTESEEIVACLMARTAAGLDLWGVAGFITLERQLPEFIPVIDGEMVVRPPRESYEQGYGSNIDFMTGATNHDGAGFILLNPLGAPNLDNNLAGTQDSLDFFMEFFFNTSGNPTELRDIVYELYPDMTSADNITRTIAATNFATEMWFAGPTHFEASHHAVNSAARGGGSTYLYEYKYRNTFLGYPDWVTASHLDDLYSIFGPLFMDVYRNRTLGIEWQEDDLRVSNEWMSYLTNFAHTGNPNLGPHDVPQPWEEFDAAANRRMVVNSENDMQHIPNELAEKYRFFVEDFPYMAEPKEPQEINFAELVTGMELLLSPFPAKTQLSMLLTMLVDEIDDDLRTLVMQTFFGMQ